MSDQAFTNFKMFREILPTLLLQHRGEHALISEGQIVEYFPSSLTAIKAGFTEFGEGRFSVELVDDTPDDLGFYSHVSAALRA